MYLLENIAEKMLASNATLLNPFPIMLGKLYILCCLFAFCVKDTVLANQDFCEYGAPNINRLTPLFSSRNPYVMDIRSGDLSPVTKTILQNGSIILLLYAPWCSVSKRAAKTFQLVAKQVHEDAEMRGKIGFVAVDCWCPMGQCRQAFKLASYPRVLVYRNHDLTKNFEFTAGLRTWQLMSLVKRVLQPMFTPHNRVELKQYLNLHENVVLGYFSPQDLLDSSSRNHQLVLSFKSMADESLVLVYPGLHNLDGIRVALTTSKQTAELLQLPPPPSITIVSAVGGNRAYIGPWTWQHVKEASRGMPEECVAEFCPKIRENPVFSAGPVVLFFLPLGLGGKVESYLKLFRRVALPYCRCHWACSVVSPSLHISCCSHYPTRLSLELATFTSHAADDSIEMASIYPSDYMMFHCLVFKTCPKLSKGTLSSMAIEEHSTQCRNVDLALCDAYHSCHCDQAGATDEQDSEKLRRRLRFRYVDIINYGLLAQRLGVRNTSKNLSLLIVDGKAGNTFVLDDKFLKINSSVLNAFISNFTLGNLKPAHRSEAASRASPQSHNNGVPADDGAGAADAEQLSEGVCNSSTPFHACIIDVVGDTFASHVLNSSKHTFLMYHLPSLGLSFSSLVPFVEVAKRRWADNTLQFARIRMDRNSLPAEYSPRKLPAFALYLASRSTASSPLLFPSDAPIDADHFDRFLEHFLCRENGCTKHMNREGTKPSHTKEMKDRSTLAQALHRYAARVSAQLKETLVQPLSDTIDSHSERLLAQTYERLSAAVDHGQVMSEAIRNASNRIKFYEHQGSLLDYAVANLDARISRLRRSIATTFYRATLRRHLHMLDGIKSTMNAWHHSQPPSPEATDIPANNQPIYYLELSELYSAVIRHSPCMLHQDNADGAGNAHPARNEEIDAATDKADLPRQGEISVSEPDSFVRESLDDDVGENFEQSLPSPGIASRPDNVNGGNGSADPASHLPRVFTVGVGIREYGRLVLPDVNALAPASDGPAGTDSFQDGANQEASTPSADTALHTAGNGDEAEEASSSHLARHDLIQEVITEVDSPVQRTFVLAAVRVSLDVFDTSELECALHDKHAATGNNPDGLALSLSETVKQLAHTVSRYSPAGSEAYAARMARLTAKYNSVVSILTEVRFQQMSVSKHLTNLRGHLHDCRLILSKVTDTLAASIQDLNVET